MTENICLAFRVKTPFSNFFDVVCMWAWRAVTAGSVHPDVDAQKCNEKQPGGFILISDNRKSKAQNSVSMMSITNLNSKFFIFLFIRSAVRDYEMIRIKMFTFCG